MQVCCTYNRKSLLSPTRGPIPVSHKQEITVLPRKSQYWNPLDSLSTSSFGQPHRKKSSFLGKICEAWHPLRHIPQRLDICIRSQSKYISLNVPVFRHSGLTISLVSLPYLIQKAEWLSKGDRRRSYKGPQGNFLELTDLFSILTVLLAYGVYIYVKVIRLCTFNMGNFFFLSTTSQCYAFKWMIYFYKYKTETVIINNHK